MTNFKLPGFIFKVRNSDSKPKVGWFLSFEQSLASTFTVPLFYLITPGLPVHHQLPEFTQTHVRGVGDAIQPSHPLSVPSPPTFNFPSIRDFSHESVCIRWPKYWNFSFSISRSNEYSGLISFRMDWLDPLAVQGTLKESSPAAAAAAAAAAKSLQSCPTLCDPIDSSPPGSAVPGILQARTLEWVAISFSNAQK